MLIFVCSFLNTVLYLLLAMKLEEMCKCVHIGRKADIDCFHYIENLTVNGY